MTESHEQQSPISRQKQESNKIAQSDWEESSDPKPNEKIKSLVRLQKTVVIDHSKGKTAQIDRSIISPEFFNSFNYSLLPKNQSPGSVTFGVTSAREGDGKTLVAANLAVSFAVANEKKTLLVDLNLRKPALHKVFDVPQSPGFLEALASPEVQVTETGIENLYLLPLGGHSDSSRNSEEHFGLEHVSKFRDIVYSLEQMFDVVIFDLPSANEHGLPRLHMKQIAGLIVVVTSGKTRKDQIDRMLNFVDENQVIGFVLNQAGRDIFR